MTRPWAIHVAMLPDELFSTWLVRAALAQGCDPIHLTGSLWPQWRAWTVDMDRGLRADRLTILATRSGLDESLLEAGMLHPLLMLVAPSVRFEQATWPWILSLGSRNRRRHGGLQFCPQCLAEDERPYFRRAWRLAWHVGCVRHGTLLADYCGRCRAPAEPHRVRAFDLTLCKCPSCGYDLRRTTTAAACSDALIFQGLADQVLINGHGLWSESVVTREAWFSLAAKSANGRILGRREDIGLPGLTMLALNLQRPSERTLRLRMAFRGMNGELRGEPLPVQHDVADLERRAISDAVSQVGTTRQPAPARPQARVQGEWIRLLRRLRVGCP
jgi:TniQ